MKVLIFTPIYYIQGRENLFHDSSAVHYLVKPWAKNHDVRVILLYSQSVKKIVRYLKKAERNYYRDGYFFEAENVKVAMCEVQQLRVSKENPFITKRLKKFVKSYLKQDNFKPDVIVAHMPSLMVRTVYELNFPVKKIAVFHQSDLKLSRKYPQLIAEFNETFDGFICRSEKIRRYFAENTSIPVDNRLVHSGIPIAKNINIDEILKDREDGIPLVLYSGKLIPRKHIDLVIKALSKLQNKMEIRLKIIGEGKELHNLKILAKNTLKAGSYEFHGFVTREEVFKEMRQASLFVMPSTEETLGLVYLEAMSQGCICIGTKGEGIEGIIEDNVNGYLIEPNCIFSLELVLQNALSMPENEKKEVREKAIRTALRFNEEDMASQYFKLISE